MTRRFLRLTRTNRPSFWAGAIVREKGGIGQRTVEVYAAVACGGVVGAARACAAWLAWGAWGRRGGRARRRGRAGGGLLANGVRGGGGGAPTDQPRLTASAARHLLRQIEDQQDKRSQLDGDAHRPDP